MIIHNTERSFTLPTDLDIQYAKALGMTALVLSELNEQEIEVLLDIEESPNDLLMVLHTLLEHMPLQTPYGEVSADSVVYNTAMRVFNDSARLALNLMTFANKDRAYVIRDTEALAAAISDAIEDKLFIDEDWDDIATMVMNSEAVYISEGKELTVSDDEMTPGVYGILGRGFTATDIVESVFELRKLETLDLAVMKCVGNC